MPADTHSELPPDPFADDGVDEMAVEMAERLIHEEVAPADPRWEHIGAEPTIDDFDAAAEEFGDYGHEDQDEWASWTREQALRSLMVRVIAVLLALGLIGMYVLSYFR